jgi:hypothetical protein
MMMTFSGMSACLSVEFWKGILWWPTAFRHVAGDERFFTFSPDGVRLSDASHDMTLKIRDPSARQDVLTRHQTCLDFAARPLGRCLLAR